jgi:hypothetical protein
MGATGLSGRGFGGLLCAVALLGTHCADPVAIAARVQAETQRDQISAELSQAKASHGEATKALTAAKAALEESTAKLAAAKAANEKLRQTARYFFDQAVSLSRATDDDAGNKSAIAAYQALIDKLPDDPLAEVSQERIAALEERMEARAQKLVADQAEVLELIASCRKSVEQADQAHKRSLRFNTTGDLNMASALAGNRRADKLREQAKTAKQKAQKLLESTPDPEGRLVKQIRSCDETD